ncbi:hypothetical protein VA596_34735 [Amycolatopsis sp., V23-08]|uniref:Uncharacterized protein n=1 Tax=Amycolatopsis heterodermiae TaxID=3110235 RepID=A0ABU5REN7_9PSEU|nr:hypothetical protein [Amycolatopsis sp., V23-08]MEA5364732.1 hypothetical protein [Amycolatopsis sp., V23-08]
MRRRRAAKRSVTNWLPPAGRHGDAVVAAPEHTRLARERSDRQVFFAIVSLAVLLAAVPLAPVGGGVPAGALVLAGLVGIVGALATLLLWRRRYAALRRTGWRRATVTIAVTVAGDSRRPPAQVRFPDGSRLIVLMAGAGLAVRALGGLPELPVLVGGHGSAMVLLILPRPPWWTRPRVIPVVARGYRWTSDG